MSELSAPAPGADDPRSGLARHQSLLFPALCGKLPRGRRVDVLDVGPAFPETVAFFNSMHCRLHFADLYSEAMVLRGSEHLGEAELEAAFRSALAVPAGTCFDLVLLWDFPNYLEDRALRAFDAVLRPLLHPRAVGHGFAVRTPDTRLRNQWYGIDQPHLFTIREPREAQLRFYPHSQAILINLLTGFDIDRGMLLPDGRLEVALRASARDA